MKSLKFFLPAIGILCFLNTQFLYAGSVRKLEPEKKLVTVELDPEETADKGSKICFFDMENKKIGCGTVKKVADKTLVVYLKSSKKFSKITEGSRATPKSLLAGGSEEDKKSSSSASNTKKISLFYTLGVMTPTTFNRIYYADPVDDNATSLWTSTNSAKLPHSVLGFGAQFSIPIKKMAIIPGFRYRILNGLIIPSDYEQGVQTPFVETTLTGSEIGAFGDFQFLRKALGTKVALNSFVGLDYVLSSVTMVTKLIQDESKSVLKEIVSAKSSVSVVSLRFGGGLDLSISKKFGFTTGLTLFVPVAPLGNASLTGKFADGESKGVNDQKADIKKSLNHTKNSVGLEVILGSFLSF